MTGSLNIHTPETFSNTDAVARVESMKNITSNSVVATGIIGAAVSAITFSPATSLYSAAAGA